MPNRHIDADDLARRRHERNLTQRQLADLIGTTAYITERWETPSTRRRAVPEVYWPRLHEALGIEPAAGAFQRWRPTLAPPAALPPLPPKPAIAITGVCPRPCRCIQWQCTWCGIEGSRNPDAHRCAFLRLLESPVAMTRLLRELAAHEAPGL